MKRIFILSGIVFFLMTLLVLTGTITFDQSMLKSMNLGNLYYKDEDYTKAREIYEGVLKEKPNNSDILYNLGLVTYAMEDYEKAIEHYTQSRDCSMELGNVYYRQGSRTSDLTQKIEIYRQGLEQYLIGIKADPNNIEIKYNYELLKKLIDDSEQKQNQEQQNQEQQNENQQNDDEKNQDDQNGEQKNQEQENENRQNDDRKNENSEEQQNNHQKGENEKEDGESPNSEREAFNNDEEADQNQKAIEQVLKMLEQQERQSLKNNQAVMDHKGEEEVNDW